jgi:hypothetical protein
MEPRARSRSASISANNQSRNAFTMHGDIHRVGSRVETHSARRIDALHTGAFEPSGPADAKVVVDEPMVPQVFGLPQWMFAA